MKCTCGVAVVMLIAGCNNSPVPSQAAATAPPPTATTPALPSATAIVPAASSAAPAPGRGVMYSVYGVAEGDVLNVRETPDVKAKKVHSYAPGSKNIAATGAHRDIGGVPWTEVRFDGGTGWVNRFYLSEQSANGGCGDPLLTAQVRAFMRAVAAKDGRQLQAVVSPLRGLTLHGGEKPIKLAPTEVATLFTSSKVYNIGPGDGGGPDITGTIKDLYDASLNRAVTGKASKETCGKLTMGTLNGPEPTLAAYAGSTPVSFYYTGEDGMGMWQTWVGALEYVDAKPYFFRLDLYQTGI